MDNIFYVYASVIFEIKIREDGWINDVFLEINNKFLPAKWVESININSTRYSVFQLCYTFDVIGKNQKAIFHFSVNGQKINCKPIYFDVLE